MIIYLPPRCLRAIIRAMSSELYLSSSLCKDINLISDTSRRIHIRGLELAKDCYLSQSSSACRAVYEASRLAVARYEKEFSWPYSTWADVHTYTVKSNQRYFPRIWSIGPISIGGGMDNLFSSPADLRSLGRDLLHTRMMARMNQQSEVSFSTSSAQCLNKEHCIAVE
jgi:hypothetical protein